MMSEGRPSQISLMVLFIVVMFVSPLGIPSLGVRFTDLAALFVLGFLFVFLAYRPSVVRHQFSFPLLFLFLFVLLEVVFPILGVAVWGSFSAASSSIRAIIYWIPFILAALLIPDEKLESIRFYRNLMIFALFANLALAVIELASFYEFIPRSFNLRVSLSGFAMEESYLYERIWSAGFFKNSTQLASFAFVLLCHFLSLAATERKNFGYLVLAALSLVLILMTTARAPLMSALLVMTLFLLLYKSSKMALFLRCMAASIAGATLWLVFYSGLPIFERYSRLTSGLSEDYSLGKRWNDHWPSALEFYKDLGHPVFTNPVGYTGVIDSGYLTYYIQGGPIFVLVLLFLMISLFIGGVYRLKVLKRSQYINYISIFIPIYPLVASATANPFRDIVIIAFFSVVVVFYSKKKVKYFR